MEAGSGTAVPATLTKKRELKNDDEDSFKVERKKSIKDFRNLKNVIEFDSLEAIYFEEIKTSTAATVSTSMKK